jgi:glutaredoxin 3
VAKVEIYVSAYCPYCHRAKALLDRKGVSYDEYVVDGDAAKRDEMTKRADGRYTVPQVFIDDVGVGGSDDIHDLDRRGKLDALLGL